MTIRYYKGKYPCQILFIGHPKVLVKWLCYCNVVGSKKLGYKSVSPNDVDIINYIRLLHKRKRSD